MCIRDSFKRDKFDIPAKVATIEYDPNRSANIALLYYSDGEKRYILAPQDLQVGDKLVSSSSAELKVGNALCLKNIPTGLTVHNIEMYPGKGAQLVRSAGTGAQIMAHDEGFTSIKLPSGEVRLINSNCYAVVGEVGNIRRLRRCDRNSGADGERLDKIRCVVGIV